MTGFNHLQTRLGIPSLSAYNKGCRCSACKSLNTLRHKNWLHADAANMASQVRAVKKYEAKKRLEKARKAIVGY